VLDQLTGVAAGPKVGAESCTSLTLCGDSPTFSFEFFPPKTPERRDPLSNNSDLESYTPHFVSVTYGAGGSTRDLTHDLVERIRHTTKLDPIPHLTCVCHNEEEIEAILLRYANASIGNILALGGDRPAGIDYDKSRDSFQHAIDLVKFIRRFNQSGAHPTGADLESAWRFP